MVVFPPIRAFFDTDTAAIFSKDLKNIGGGPICDQELRVISMIAFSTEVKITIKRSQQLAEVSILESVARQINH